MKYTTNIPKARNILLEIAENCEAKGLKREATRIRETIESFMIRRPGPRRAPSTRSVVNDATRQKVLHDLSNTDMPQEDIARKYNIDGGRVSEIYRSTRN